MKTARFKSALKAAGIHFCCSLLVALLVGALVFGIWYPHPYRELAGGRELFLLVMGVDLVCGPLLTLVLYNPAKPKRELWTDLTWVVLVQLAALGYGVWTVHQARPLYLVHEVDRFKVIARVDVDAAELDKLPESLKPQFFQGPQTVALREVTADERNKVLFESVQGGRDYGERPSFYAPYSAELAAKAYQKAKPLVDFARKHPERSGEVNALTGSASSTGSGKLWRYLPITARQDWVAVLNTQGAIVGYVQGDGF